MKSSSRMVSAAILSVLLLALVVSPIHSRKILSDNQQSDGNREPVDQVGRVPRQSPPSPQANANRPDPPAVERVRHH